MNNHILQEQSHTFNQSILSEEYQDMDKILEQIDILEDYQKQCQAQGKYMEAQTSKVQVKEMKEKYLRQLLEETDRKHKEELMHLEKQHLGDFHDFNVYWDKKADDYLVQASLFDRDLQERHQEEQSQFEMELNNCIPMNTKETSEMLNLKKIQLQLAKNQNYNEAHKVQKKYQDLEQQQHLKYLDSREIKIKNLKKQLEQKQDNELKALQKKIQTGTNQQKKLRTTELQRMLQKYTNIKSEIEIQQKQELQRYEKDFTQLQKGNNVSKSKMYESNMSKASSKYMSNATKQKENNFSLSQSRSRIF